MVCLLVPLNFVLFESEHDQSINVMIDRKSKKEEPNWIVRRNTRDTF